MSDDTPDGTVADAPPRPGRRGREPGEIRRVNIAINVAVQMLCAVALFLLVNLLADRHYKRWDLSAAKKYSISGDTSAYLGQLDDEVRITMAFLGGSKVRGQLKTLLEEYERLGEGQVVFEEFDPARDKTRAIEVAERYEMAIDQNVVFVEVGGRVKRVTERDMLEDNGRAFSGEAAITSAMLAATEGRPKTVYLIAGKGRLREVGGRTALEELLDLSARHFFTLKELTLGNVTEIPADADALLLVNPESDFSPGEVELLSGYWEDERGSMVLLLNPSTDMPNFYPFLRKLGVRVRGDHRVMYAQVSGIGGAKKIGEVQSRFLEGSPVTAGQKNKLTIFGGQTCPLEVAENNEVLKAKGVIATALLEADAKFWGERDHAEAAPKPGPGDILPPVYVAASIEKGGSDDAIVKLDSSRMVVVGNSTLLDPGQGIRTNAEFVMNSINWTLDRDERIDILPKPAVNTPVKLSPESYRNLFNLVVLILPAVAFCFAIFVWSSRRN